MINHARTLLLNGHTTGPGAEYISPDYKPKKLTGTLQNVWNMLYGKDLDDYAKNYRTRQLMTILHSTDLVKYVYALDPRVTYWPVVDKTCYGPEPTGLAPLELLPQDLEIVLNKNRGLFSTTTVDVSEFEQRWKTDCRFTHRMSGLLLAHIYQTDVLNEVEER
jgi:hypothetical protein